MGKGFNNFMMWLHGLAAATIAGGASAVTAGFVAPAISPQSFNFGGQLVPLAKLSGALFAVNGFIAAMAYLKQSPLPPDSVTTVTAKTTNIQPTEEGIKVAEVTKTTTTDKN